jgi:hypothetical protein
MKTKVYKVKEKELYEKLNMVLAGFAFFRKTDKEYFIKTQKNPTTDSLLKLGFLEEISE